MITYTCLQSDEITPALFSGFIRRQVVEKCRRKVDGNWLTVDEPFIDDWSEADYNFLVNCLKNTADSGGFVYAAFVGGTLKGFTSVEAELFGKNKEYLGNL